MTLKPVLGLQNPKVSGGVQPTNGGMAGTLGGTRIPYASSFDALFIKSSIKAGPLRAFLRRLQHPDPDLGGCVGIHAGHRSGEWRVMGSANLAEFAPDHTGVSIIGEISPGVYQALVNLSGAGDHYFLRVERVVD